MLNTFAVPAWLHDMFGETQTPLEVLLILGFGLAMTILWFTQSPELAGIPWWKLLLAALLAFDVFSGCIANFTRGTSNYYAQRPRNRLVFMAVHIHLLVFAWLIGADIAMALLLWAGVIVGAWVVNAMVGHPLQLVTAAVFVCGAMAMVVIAGSSLAFTLVALFFALKVIFSFGVDHYGAANR